MSDKKYCPFRNGGIGYIRCISKECELWDSDRNCCGLKQIAPMRQSVSVIGPVDIGEWHKQ